MILLLLLLLLLLLHLKHELHLLLLHLLLLLLLVPYGKRSDSGGLVCMGRGDVWRLSQYKVVVNYLVATLCSEGDGWGSVSRRRDRN